MKSLGVTLTLTLGVLALALAGSTAVAAPGGQAQVSAKAKLKKCKAKKTAKARKKCRKNAIRKAKLKRQAKNTWWVDLAGVASRHPRRVDMTDPVYGAPPVQNLKWKKWGHPKTSARGVMMEPGIAPGDPGMPIQVTINGRKRIKCKAKFGTKKGKRIFVYRKVILKAQIPFAGLMESDISSVAGSQVCKSPAPTE